jgi:uncharacterized metal-binding protein YceD (DUF177 family)
MSKPIIARLRTKFDTKCHGGKKHSPVFCYVRFSGEVIGKCARCDQTVTGHVSFGPNIRIAISQNAKTAGKVAKCPAPSPPQK